MSAVRWINISSGKAELDLPIPMLPVVHPQFINIFARQVFSPVGIHYFPAWKEATDA